MSSNTNDNAEKSETLLPTEKENPTQQFKKIK